VSVKSTVSKPVVVPLDWPECTVDQVLPVVEICMSNRVLLRVIA
jgi:hypothetical protein